MQRIANFIVNKRFVLLAVVLAFTVVCAFLSAKVETNTDMTKYLPDKSDMRHGLEIMNTDFPAIDDNASIRVMFDDLDKSQVSDVKAHLESIPYVSAVDYEADNINYNRDNHTLFVVNTEYDYGSDEEISIETAIGEMSSAYQMIFQSNNVQSSEVSLLLLMSALSIALLILFIMSRSWLEPVLFMATIGVAVVINLGTNLVLSYTSELTKSVAPIIQLVLSMDYSIILMNRYRQEKLIYDNKTDAMKAALANSFSSIASSSLTTVAGLLALVFLSFKIGPELGIVLAKGVFISMVCVFTVLPVLILLCDKGIEKSEKKSLNIPMGFLAKFSYKARFVMPVIFVAMFVAFYILHGNTDITFTEGITDPMADIFPKDNTVVLIYDNDDESGIEKIIAATKDDKLIKSVVGYTNTLGKQYDAKEMSEAISAIGAGFTVDESLVRMVYYLYYNEEIPDVTAEDFMAFLKNDVMTNEILSGNIDKSVLKDIELTEKYANKKALTEKKNARDMADFFNMSGDDIKKLYLYYFTENGGVGSGRLALSDFADFVVNTVARDKAYSSMLDASALSQMKTLQTYASKSEMTKPRNYEDAAAILEIDERSMKTIYLFCKAEDEDKANVADSGEKLLSVREIINYLVKNSSMFSAVIGERLADLETAQSLINAAVDESVFTSSELAKLVGMDKSQAESLYLLYISERGDTSGWKISPQEFVGFITKKVLPNKSFASYFDKKTAADLKNGKTLIDAVVSGKAYSASEMYSLLDNFTSGISQGETEMMYVYYAAANSQSFSKTMKIPQMLDYLCDDIVNDERFLSVFDEGTKSSIVESKSDLNDALAQMKGDKYSRLIFTTDYPEESEATTAFVAKLDDLRKNFLKDESYLVGTSAMVYEMESSFDKEFFSITLITAVAIFVVVLLAFRNIIVSLLLTLLVQCGVYVTVSVLGFSGHSIYYLALLIVQSILMGATIDYGIVFSDYYRESRKKEGRKPALKSAYDGSIHTIMTSGSILILVTAILGLFSSAEVISQVTLTISIGSLIAALLITLVLPGMICFLDRFAIKRRKKGKRATKKEKV